MRNIVLIFKRELVTNRKAAQLLHVTSCFCILFFIYWGLFVLFAPFFRSYQPDLNTLAPWIRISFIPALEGAEAQVLFFSSIVYVMLALMVVRYGKRLPWFSKRGVQAVCLGVLFASVAGILIERSRLDPVLMLPPLMNASIALFLPPALFILYFLYKRMARSAFHHVFSLLLFTVFTVLVILQLDEASAFDYGFVIGPALKLSFGEHLGSFYMQYGLFMTYLFKWMVDLRLTLSHMQVVMGVIFALWYVFFWLLAKKLIKDSRLAFLCLVALFGLRFLAIRHDPTLIPQASPMRLDLWAPLLLVAYTFGLTSPFTALSFAIGYLLDNSFGLFYILAYYATVGSLFVLGFRKRTIPIKSFALLFAPLLVALGVQVMLFGSLFSSAALLYARLLISFIPTSYTSYLWIVLAFLPIALYSFLLEPDARVKQVLFLFFAITLIQLNYFYGRSHEHNLLNLSGLLVFLFFFTLDRLRRVFSLRYSPVLLGVGFIVLGSVFFSGEANRKLTRAWARLATLNFSYTNTADSRAEEFAKVRLRYRTQKVYLLSDIDSYVYYRNNIHPPGYFNPFWANVLLDDTVGFLLDLVDQGYTLVFWKDERFILDFLEKLNQSSVIQKKAKEFDYVDSQDRRFWEVVLIPHATASATLKGEMLEYTDPEGFSLRFPQDFSLTQTNNGLRLRESDGIFTIVIEPKKRQNRQSVEQFVEQESLIHGFKEKEGLAKVPNVELAFVRFWARNPLTPAEKLQFFLFKKEKVLEVRVWPSTSPTMGKFDAILGSIRIQ